MLPIGPKALHQEHPQCQECHRPSVGEPVRRALSGLLRLPGTVTPRLGGRGAGDLDIAGARAACIVLILALTQTLALILALNLADSTFNTSPNRITLIAAQTLWQGLILMRMPGTRAVCCARETPFWSDVPESEWGARVVHGHHSEVANPA